MLSILLVINASRRYNDNRHKRNHAGRLLSQAQQTCMKLLMLGWELPPHNSGGLGVACYHLAKALANRGANIDFVVPYQADHPETEFMTIHAATKRKVHEREIGELAYSQSQEVIRTLQYDYIRFVEKHVKTNRPDVIHAHDWLTMEAGIHAKRVSGVPLIVHVHATEFDRSGADSTSWGNPVIHEIEQAGLLMADRIFTVSRITKNILVDRYDIPAEKIEVVHNAFDPASLPDYLYQDHTYRYLESLKAEGYTVVSALTRLTVQKGLTHLIKGLARASERYDKLVLLLAGDGEQRDELIRLAADYGVADRVFFTGFVRGRKWRDAYSVSDVFVMSSVSEPFGLTALEAAHHGCALVVTKQSGVSEILDSVFRYDFWDVDRLADQLIAIATSPALQSSLRNNVRSEYARLSWDEVARRCLGHYSNAKQGALL